MTTRKRASFLCELHFGELLTCTIAVENLSRPKADANDTSQVGAPMAGVVVELRVHVGSEVKKGDPVAVLSAMKMVIGLYRLILSNFINTDVFTYLGNGHFRTTFWKGRTR